MTAKGKVKQGFALCLAFSMILTGFLIAVSLDSSNALGTDVSGLVSADTTWDVVGSPYIVVGNLTIESGATLTIEPGVQVRFDGYLSIYVEGNLSAVGNDTDRIVFTSNKTSPVKGDWKSIQANSTGRVDLEFCNVTHGFQGIYLGALSDGNTIKNSTFSYNSNNGIYLSTSDNNQIINNTVSMNTNGIFISQSSNNTLTGNTILMNGIGAGGNGIQLSSSTLNRIYHNNIIDSAVKQAIDNGNTNMWNDTYPSGGNYWSDLSPTCADLHSGSSTPQLTGGPDGICDDKRSIDADSFDYYPLVDPWGLPATALTGTVVGRVVDESHAPISGATVSLEDPDLVIEKTNTSDSAGSFVLDNASFGLYTVYASMTGYGYNRSVSVSLSPASLYWDVGDIVLSQVKGTITINLPVHGNYVFAGDPLWVQGNAFSDISPFGPIPNLPVVVKVVDSGGGTVFQTSTYTSSTGVFDQYVDLPSDLQSGDYQVCVSSDFGDIEEDCVSITVQGGFGGAFSSLALLILVILIIVVVIIVLAAFSMSRRPTTPREPYPPYGQEQRVQELPRAQDAQDRYGIREPESPYKTRPPPPPRP